MSWKELNNAKISKNDEFYTKLDTIQKELAYYKKHFNNSSVICLCDYVDKNDNSKSSKFYQYFKDNFDELGLSKLTCISYNPSGKGMLYCLDKSGESYGELNGDGDFRSEESISYLKSHDISVTNPPFSLFRDFVDLHIMLNKKFIILGHQNAIGYVNCFECLKENKMWLGKSIHSGDVEFMIPDEYEAVSKSVRYDEDGNKYVKVPGIRWYTNLQYEGENKELVNGVKYESGKYDVVENFENTINVNRTKDIPDDYYGIMAVPITFVDKYCRNQYELIKLLATPKVNGKNIFKRVLIRKKP